MRVACEAFNTAAGYFKQTLIKPIAEGVINLVVSIALVNKIGMTGVFIGTTVSLLLGSVWVDPFVLFRKWFKKNVTQYAICYSEMAVFAGIIGVVINIAGQLFLPDSFMTLIIHALMLGLICMVLVLTTTLVLPGRREVLVRLKGVIKKSL